MKDLKKRELKKKYLKPKVVDLGAILSYGAGSCVSGSGATLNCGAGGGFISSTCFSGGSIGVI